MTHGAGLIDLWDYLPRSSRKSCKLESTSLRSAQRWCGSLAISSVTSRDQPRAVLKATMRIGASYYPSSRSLISVARSASKSLVSRHTWACRPKSSSTM